jgi:hypothetical protein
MVTVDKTALQTRIALVLPTLNESSGAGIGQRKQKR